MIISSEMETRIVDAGSEAMADYNRAVILYQHRALTKKEFIGIANAITGHFINAVDDIKVGDNNV